MSRSTRTLWLSAVLATSGCAAVGPDFSPPVAGTAAGYAVPGDHAAPEVRLTADKRSAGPWWRALGSPQLDAVMTEALADNPTTAEAVSTLERSRAEVDVADADRKPRIDATAGAERERINFQSFGFSGFPGLPPFPNPTISLLNVGATVSYGLDLFGGTRRRIETAKAEAEGQARRADAAFLALTGNVALQAVRIAALQQEQVVLQDIVEDDRAGTDIIRRAQVVGGEARTAGLGGQAQLQADLALAPAVSRQVAEAKHALAGLVGKAPGAWAPPDFHYADFTSPSTIALAVPSALVRGRPDVLAAEADLHADTARVGVATANQYPNLNLLAGLSQQALTPGALFSFDSTAYNFGASAAAPLFHGGALRASRRAAEAQARASLARYRRTVVSALVQVADVLTAIAEDDRRLETLKASASISRASLLAAEDAYRLGGGARAQIVVARRRVDQNRLALLEAEGARLQDVVTLYAATASDWGRPSSR